MADKLKRIRSSLAGSFSKLSPVTTAIIYAIMVILILAFFSGHGEFIYEG